MLQIVIFNQENKEAKKPRNIYFREPCWPPPSRERSPRLLHLLQVDVAGASGAPLVVDLEEPGPHLRNPSQSDLPDQFGHLQEHKSWQICGETGNPDKIGFLLAKMMLETEQWLDIGDA